MQEYKVILNVYSLIPYSVFKVVRMSSVDLDPIRAIIVMLITGYLIPLQRYRCIFFYIYLYFINYELLYRFNPFYFFLPLLRNRFGGMV